MELIANTNNETNNDVLKTTVSSKYNEYNLKGMPS